MNEFMEFLKKYKWRVVFAVFGLLFTILIFTIGFWRTLVLFLIVGAAFFIGMLMDHGGRGNVAAFFSRIFKRG